MKSKNYEVPFYVIFPILLFVTSSPLGVEYSPQYRVLKHPHNLCSSLSARDQVLHPYKTTSKVWGYFGWLGCELAEEDCSYFLACVWRT
jgi:hypothetical protein